MGLPYADRIVFCSFMLLTIFCLLYPCGANAQQSRVNKQDTAKNSLYTTITDSLRKQGDTAIKAADHLLDYKKQQVRDKLKEALPGKPRLNVPVPDSSLIDIQHPFRHLFVSKPVVKFNGGYVSYNFNYRSNIDTPYTEKDISQHQLAGRLNFTVAGIVPLQVNYWVRRSNSSFFRDVTDVQVAFDGAAFRQRLQETLRARMMALSAQLKDSVTGQLYQLKKLQHLDVETWLKNPLNQQALIEANEVVRIPRVTYDPHLPDSVNVRREDSLKKAAAFFIDLYRKTQTEYVQLQKQLDSLKQVYDNNTARIQQYKQMLQGRDWLQGAGLQKLKTTLQHYGLDSIDMPAKYKWLLGLRTLSIGRSPVAYSELTAKNLSITGLNFEYNSWYYLAVTAGLVDYRFRDFAVSRLNRKPQYLYMVRAGIGRLEKSYFILSAFHGQKQLFTSGASARLSALTVTGFSAEAKWQVHSTTYLTGEIATSLSPDYHTNPETKTTFNLQDKNNKAYALKAYSYLPYTATKLEGTYKFTGANYQSFSSFQTNAAQESWYLKAEQHFFKKRLKINAALRSNEFSNPYIVQQYKSNTVFKSITATWRMRKWPVISLGYQPMSQLTMLDSQVVENRFQSLNASGYYQFKIRDLPTATTIVFNQFYNTSADTGFVYYNAVNVYASQSFFFNRFTANVAVSHTANTSYALNVLDGGIQLNLQRIGTIGMGVKVNSFNRNVVKTGGYLNAGIKVGKADMIYASYEQGYLPGFKGGLVRNGTGNVQFIKYFGSR